MKHRDGFPVCPWCGHTNMDYGSFRIGDSPVIHSGYFWAGPTKAVRAGGYAKLFTRKGRIYGGGNGRWSEGPKPVRVNERRWKIVPSGVRLLVACSNPFHDQRNPGEHNVCSPSCGNH